jgi:hypothetical protein
LMARYGRIFMALTILLSGLALVPHAGLFAGVVRWQRFSGGYEDVVTVTRARYRDGELEMRAISSSGGLPTLSVYRTSTNELIGNLVWEADEGEHRGDFNLPGNPQVVTVRSTFGGESTVLVWDESDPPITVTPSASATPGGPTSTATSVPPSATPGGPTSTATSIPPSVTPGGPTLTATSIPPSVTPGGPTLTATSVPPSVTPGGPTLTATATSVPPTLTASVTPGGPTLTATAVPGSNSTLYLPLINDWQGQ